MLGETISAMKIVGVLLIIGGVILVNMTSDKKQGVDAWAVWLKLHTRGYWLDWRSSLKSPPHSPLCFSNGFTRPLPAFSALTAFGSALYLVSLALVHLPVSTAYPVWAGGSTAGVALLSLPLSR